MPTQVERTLLKSLFQLDQCKILPQRREVYFALFDRVFPNADGYRVFLSTTDYNEKIEIAKKLLGQLCFESNYPPPYELLTDIATQEAESANRSRSLAYIPQDHFVHLLNLYILGLYIFFCHPSINRELTYHFMDMRVGDSNTNRVLSSTKDFLSSWKYFCLYHDVSYPIEFRFKYNKPKEFNDSMKWSKDKFKKEYLELCELGSSECEQLNIYNTLAVLLQKELVIEALAKLVVLREVLTDKANTKFDRVFRSMPYAYSSRNGQSVISSGNLSDRFSDYVSLDKIFSYEHLKLLFGVVDKKDVISVLFDSNTEIPIAIMYYEIEKENYVLFFATEILDERSVRIASYQLTNEDSVIDSSRRIRYFVRNPLDLLSDALPKNGKFSISISDLNELTYIIGLYERSTENRNSNFNKIKSYAEMCEYIYGKNLLLRSFCNQAIGFEKMNDFRAPFYADKLRENARNAYSVFLTKELKDVIKKCISESFTEDAHMQQLVEYLTKTNRLKDNRDKQISEYIEKVFNETNILESKREIKKAVIESVDGTVKKKLDSYNIVTKLIYSTINTTGIRKCGAQEQLGWVTGHGLNISKLIDEFKSDDRLMGVRSALNKLMIEKYNVTLKQLEDEYYNVPYYDHGINSSLIYLAISSMYMKSIVEFESDRSPFSKCVETLVWPVIPSSISQKLFENYESVIFETYRAILFHNIYSKAFKDTFCCDQWETDMSDNPFTFFCILSDSLQKWGRRRFYDYRGVDYKSDIAMDDYDISIEKDIIMLSVSSYRKDIDNVKKKMIDELDDFLKNCTNYLGIRINELI